MEVESYGRKTGCGVKNLDARKRAVFCCGLNVNNSGDGWLIFVKDGSEVYFLELELWEMRVVGVKRAVGTRTFGR